MQDREVLNVTDAASFLRVDRTSLYDWGADGPPSHILGGKKRRVYLRSELLEWVKGQPDAFTVNSSAEGTTP